MKTMNRILLSVAMATSFAFVSQALADDGIAASPKTRQALNDRQVVATTTTSAPAMSCCAVCIPGANATASPKVRQMFADQAKSCIASSGGTTVSQVADGVAASPKVRAQLNER